MSIDGIKPPSRKPVSQKPDIPVKNSSKKPNIPIKNGGNVGGVTFTGDTQYVKEVKTSKINGKNVYSVFLNDGRKIEYPEQKGNVKVEITNEMAMDITNMHGATITGSPKKHDGIFLKGNSSNNTVIVDNEPFLMWSGNHFDNVELGSDTHDNEVRLGQDDRLALGWHDSHSTGFEGKPIYVEGKGVSNQEAQLQDALTPAQYKRHKIGFVTLKNGKLAELNQYYQDLKDGKLE